MGGGIGQWLLFRAEDRSLSLFSLVVPSGAQTPVHDHLAWGLVGLYRGTQDEDIYAERGDGIELVESRALAPGDFYALIPPTDDIHRVRTTSPADLGLDPPAHERHRLRLAPRLRRGLGRADALPLGLRQRALRRGLSRVRRSPCVRPVAPAQGEGLVARGRPSAAGAASAAPRRVRARRAAPGSARCDVVPDAHRERRGPAGRKTYAGQPAVDERDARERRVLDPEPAGAGPAAFAGQRRRDLGDARGPDRDSPRRSRAGCSTPRSPRLRRPRRGEPRRARRPACGRRRVRAGRCRRRAAVRRRSGPRGRPATGTGRGARHGSRRRAPSRTRNSPTHGRAARRGGARRSRRGSAARRCRPSR